MREALHTNAHRLKAVDAACESGVSTSLASENKCHRSTLYRWTKRRQDIEAAAAGSTTILQGRRGPKVAFPELEKKLLDWVRDMRKNKVRAVTSRCLLMMSAHLEPRFLLGRSEQAAVEYLRRFRSRNGLSVRRITHKGRRKRSEVQVVADEFGLAMRHKMEMFSAGTEKYNHFYNMDQTSIYIDMNPKTTITFRGERDVDVVQGMSENSFRASVFLCASATGKKLPAFIVFSGATGGPVHCELQAHPLHKADEVVLTVQKNAYCDERIMIEWVNEVWTPSVTFCRMLLLDSLKVHKMGSVRAKLEEAMTGVDFVPAGATGLAQPMDVSVMRVFKHWCRELYVQHHITNDFSLNAKERRKLITFIVHEAWRAVPPKQYSGVLSRRASFR
ncbi:DDE superfamily endonuclease [Phytophthora infestans]|uniref:DDE superfamily endonuclease n=1 Tax=Phytophthora infestans TaxID=4787 RepID=A0A8S9V1L7_PHYIN|nr:DDE superfamily endonuclease [Phytophthora infestans]